MTRNLVEVSEPELVAHWRTYEGPPEPAWGPVGDCPKCGGCLIYGFGCEKYVCITCWSVFREDE